MAFPFYYDCVGKIFSTQAGNLPFSEDNFDFATVKYLFSNSANSKCSKFYELVISVHNIEELFSVRTSRSYRYQKIIPSLLAISVSIQPSRDIDTFQCLCLESGKEFLGFHRKNSYKRKSLTRESRKMLKSFNFFFFFYYRVIKC